MKHFKYHLIKIKHKDNTTLTKLDKNRINRDYLIAEVQFGYPCIVLCQDDDYNGFYTSNVVAIDNTDNHLTLGTMNTTYYFTKKEVTEE